MKDCLITKIGQYLYSKGGHVRLSKPDRCRLRKRIFDIDIDEQREEWNDIYQTLLCSELKYGIKRTEKGQIRKCRENRRGVWEVTGKKGGVGITIVAIVEGHYFAYFLSRPMDMNGTLAYTTFKKKCKDNGILLEDYMVDNGEEINKTISKPLIKMYRMGETLDGCHHLDYHSSYPAGLCNTHPEFRPIIDELYKERKTKPENKLVLDATIGYMHSEVLEWRLANLAKDAIEDNNNRILNLAERLKAAGREIIGFNTDGIWYRGEIYHGDGEGKNLGDWENDHVNCIFRSKSDGAYEFIEGGKYYPVLRGKTNYDDVKPRTEWEWGDIYRTGLKLKTYHLTHEGVILREVELDGTN